MRKNCFWERNDPKPFIWVSGREGRVEIRDRLSAISLVLSIFFRKANGFHHTGSEDQFPSDIILNGLIDQTGSEG